NRARPVRGKGISRLARPRSPTTNLPPRCADTGPMEVVECPIASIWEYLRKQAKTILKQIINRCGVTPAGLTPHLLIICFRMVLACFRRYSQIDAIGHSTTSIGPVSAHRGGRFVVGDRGRARREIPFPRTGRALL